MDDYDVDLEAAEEIFNDLPTSTVYSYCTTWMLRILASIENMEERKKSGHKIIELISWTINEVFEDEDDFLDYIKEKIEEG